MSKSERLLLLCFNQQKLFNESKFSPIFFVPLFADFSKKPWKYAIAQLVTRLASSMLPVLLAKKLQAKFRALWAAMTYTTCTLRATTLQIREKFWAQESNICSHRTPLWISKKARIARTPLLWHNTSTVLTYGALCTFLPMWKRGRFAQMLAIQRSSRICRHFIVLFSALWVTF